MLSRPPTLKRLDVELLSKVVTIYPVPRTIRPHQIAALFSHGGPIKDIRYDYDEVGRQNLQVYIRFYLYESAAFVFKNARTEAYFLNGTRVYVWSDLNRKWTKHRFGINVQAHGTRLFIQNLSPSTTEQQLARYFAEFGLVVSSQIFVKHGASMGKATVTFAKQADAIRAMELASHSSFDGKMLDIKLDPTFRSLGDMLLPDDNNTSI